ncbi:hypothetical protein DEU56DRAFT_832533 [Suillus clintonianus]|uniref:uncharacterized protein n=1 Tax=Suillus clintonianus TaxID=1904413 RepID=UPI001B85DEB1|nr:uncharacterized protein DEU56DRAFT_832533 [Suillus clintonianus]KAG2122361.1 hypothetical protein DEU56DRAFT_832533 [Suillus clintonianus]
MQTSIKHEQDTGVWEVGPSTWREIRYGSVTWSFDTQHSPALVKPVSHPKPPHYHGSLLRTSRPRRRYTVFWKAKPFGPSQDPTTLPHNSADEWSLSEPLNHKFIGVQVAEDVLKPYELESGFAHSIMPDITLDELYTSWTKLSVDVDEEEVEFARSRWTELAQDLVGDIQLSRPISTSDLDGGRPQSPLSSLEYDSEPSTESDTLPSTPTQRSAFSDVEVHEPSPVLDSRGLSPPKALNGSARAFTPKSGPPSKFSISPSPDSSSRSSSSPTPVNFVFPAINGNYQYLPPGLKKDDQGFYTSITPPDSPSRARLDSSRPSSRLSSTRLPQFLSDAQSRKASKTRVIVDQMRATPVSSKKGRPRNHSKSSSDSLHSPGPSTSPSEGDKKSPSTVQGGDHDSDTDSPFSPGNHVTPGRNGWMELPSPTFGVKALVSNSAARPSFPTASSFPDMPFHVQPPAPPGPFYHLPRAPGYPYSYVPARAPPPPPPLPPTSWVPVAAPTYASSMYARPIVW